MTLTGKEAIRTEALARDVAALVPLDLTFQSDRIFRTEKWGPDHLVLTAVPVSPAVTRSYAQLKNDLSPFDQGWLLWNGENLAGVIAVEYRLWNRRLVVSHFYVDRPQRRRGYGRILMELALEWGRARGALTAWAETSNVNYPAVLAYRRLGFELSGCDLTLYRGTPNDDEFAVFLARAV